MPVSFVNLPVSIFREDKYFIAYTPALDLSTFEALVEKGTTDEILTNLGWKKVKTKRFPPVEVDHRLETIRIQQAI